MAVGDPDRPDVDPRLARAPSRRHVEVFFFYCFGDPRDLHSFPTRRSSDLTRPAPSRPAATSSARSATRSTPGRWSTPACSSSPSPPSCSPRAARRHSWRSSATAPRPRARSEEHTSELQSQSNLVCRLLLEKKKMWGMNLTGIPFATDINGFWIMLGVQLGLGLLLLLGLRWRKLLSDRCRC